MAGAKTTGQCAVSSTLVSRSSARPLAARASRSAVAGATKTRSTSWPILTCGTRWTSSNTEVCTGRAGQRGPGADADELQRRRSRHHGDVVAGALQPSQQLAGLVRGDAARHPEDDATHARPPVDHQERLLRQARKRVLGVLVHRLPRGRRRCMRSLPSLTSRSAIESGFS